MKDFILVIPARKKNRHFKDGDLQQISGQSLVSWKLNQIENLIYKYRTFLVVDEYVDLDPKFNGRVKQLLREGESIFEVKKQLSNLIDGGFIIWLNCNLPFLTEDSIKAAIEIINSSDTYDSLTSVSLDKEFYTFKGKPLNFNPKDEMVRGLVDPLVRLNNAIYIYDSSIQNKSLLGFNVHYFEIPEIESFELSSSYDESEIKLKFINFIVNQSYTQK
jgi:CMP-N-acetylneuraminic acid synthetase